MAIGAGVLIEIVMKQKCLGQDAFNVFQYVADPPTGDADPVDLGHAWWSNISTTYRGLISNAATHWFKSVLVRELDNPTGAYGEYPIPDAEQVGARVTTGDQDMPPFTVASLRLSVGTRATRPGHKRVSGLFEMDNNGGVLQAPYINLFNAWGVVVSNDMTLGSPSLLTVLHPIVCKKNATGSVIAHQPVTGFAIDGNISSQNTRKIGRGS